MVDSPSQLLRQIAKLRKCDWGRNQSGVSVLTDEPSAEESSTAAEEFNQQQPKVSRVSGALKNAKEARGSSPTRPPVERLSADSPTEASPVSCEIASVAPVVDSDDETALDAAPEVQPEFEEMSAEEDRKRKMDALRCVSIFEDLTDDELVHVADVAQTVRYPAGTRLIQKNETCGIFHFVLEGAVECTDIDPAFGEGSDMVITSGESIQGGVVLRDLVFEANATTKSDVALLALHHEDLVRVMEPLHKVVDNKYSMPMIQYLEIMSRTRAGKEKLVVTFVARAMMEMQGLKEKKKEQEEFLEGTKKKVEETKEFNRQLLKKCRELNDANAALEKEVAALKKEKAEMQAEIKKNMCPYRTGRGSCKGRRALADKPNGN
jgi:CRP-like cAMP-binding protein